MHRFLRGVLAAAALALAACGGEPGTPVRNLVLVCIDTVRFDTFFLPERAGFENALDPRLDEAVVYTRAHAAGPWTVPSVVSVFTGLYPAQHGAGRFPGAIANLNEDVPSRLPEAAMTLAERLRGAGFSTGAFVAHPWFRSGYGMEQGFDQLHLRKGSENVLATGMQWLDVENVEPFFLYLHFMEAHDKHLKEDRLDEFLAQARPEELAAAREFAPGGICEDPGSLMCRRYQVYAAKTMDEREALAALLDGLAERGLLEETAVLVYSDHGEEFHDHLERAQDLGADPRGVFGFGHGQSLYQELMHVPLIAWHPGLPGQSVDRVTSLVDVAPTLLQWAGADEEGADFAGRALPASERGNGFDWRDYEPDRWPQTGRRVFASGIAYGPEQIAVLAEGWKYVWHEADGRSELFNLQEDPGEDNPVAAPDAAASLEPALDRYFEWFSQQRFEAPNLSDEQVRQLKGVGYLQGRETARPDESGETGENPGDGDG